MSEHPTFRRLQALAISAGVAEQQLRSEYMQFLYEQSGRTCGTLSGLWQEHKAACLDDFAQQLAEGRRREWGQGRAAS